MPGYVITLADAGALHASEAVSADQVHSLAAELQLVGQWTQPIVVECSAGVVLDGNHRVTLGGWRPGEPLGAAELVAAAVAGRLLPLRSVRLRLERALPHCRVPLHRLAEGAMVGRPVESTPALARPAELLAAGYHALGRRIGIATLAARRVDRERPETLAPHPRLRQMLQADPAMAALLPGALEHFSLGGIEPAPYEVLGSGLILLGAALLDSAAALAVAARWGLEAAQVRFGGPADVARLGAVLRHARGLLEQVPAEARDLLLSGLPPAVAAELWGGDLQRPTRPLLDWQARRIGLQSPAPGGAAPAEGALELEQPVEAILVAGGDSRLTLDALGGQNRYGVPPRPRPEAVHFSSSTASAVSDHGFLFCDLLRRDLLRAVQVDGVDAGQLVRRTADAIGRDVCRLIGLDADEADVAITASGTDAELHAVLLARAAAGGGRLTNILIAPEESGRGVALAAAGCYFDEHSATGLAVTKGEAAWPQAEVHVLKVPIREADGRPRTAAQVEAEASAALDAALGGGGRALLHVLIASKTGLSAPRREAVQALVAAAPGRVDVVVDACQMRSTLADLGELVRDGWMVQVSGSKFLTGPPFSGALVIPRALRARVDAVATALATAPAVGHPDVWSAWWAERLGRRATGASFGPLFRWLPALLEARLLDSLPVEFRRAAFGRFRAAVSERLAASPYVQLIDVGEPAGADEFVRLSIQSFQVLGRRWDQELVPLDESACRRIFELLNRDLRSELPGLSPAEQVLAALQCHIGQPVAIAGKAVLRMVLGARFFNIVGFAGPGAIEAALQSEISDALRAIAKLELLASRWWRLSRGEG